jgi:hypothetical protein
VHIPSETTRRPGRATWLAGPGLTPGSPCDLSEYLKSRNSCGSSIGASTDEGTLDPLACGHRPRLGLSGWTGFSDMRRQSRSQLRAIYECLDTDTTEDKCH